MVKVKKMVLDVLKPHAPSILDMAKEIAEINVGNQVDVIVKELDKDTESVKIELSGNDLTLDLVTEKLAELGASLHSIDEIVAVNEKSAS